MSLTEQRLKEQQLKLLEVSGFCLAEYCDLNKQSMLFRDISTQTTEKELNKLKTLRIKSAGMSANANLKAFLCVMLHSIYMGEIKEDILSNVKSALYDESIDLTKVKHSNLPPESNQQLKKLVVQFLYSIEYSHFDDRVESKLAKYPIIMDILVIFLRKILEKHKVRNADDLIFHIPTKEAFALLVEFFDFNCKCQNQLYLFYEDRFFIYQNNEGEMMMGCYVENKHQEEIQFKNPFISEDSSEGEEQPEASKQQESPNRSLQLRGIVGESIVLDPDTATPFFQFDQESLSSFKTSKNQSQIQEADYQHSPSMKMSKEVSLLKKMDIMQQSQQIGLGSNINMKKTVILQSEKQQKEQKSQLRQVADTPLTSDSNKALQLPFQKQIIGNQVQDVRVLKKSHSETMSKPMLEVANDKSNLSESPVKKIDHLPKYSNEKRKQVCNCVVEKQKKNKLSSNLYEINISHVEEHLRFSKKKIYGILSGKFIGSINNESGEGRKEGKKEFPKGPPGGTFFKKNNKVFFRNPRTNASITPTKNPQSIYSEVFSKKQFSPISHNKSISPQSTHSKPTTPPKVFQGKHPLKYSARLKSAKFQTKENL